MHETSGKVIRFCDYRLDLWRGRLHRQEQEINLRPKCFDLLRYFAENAGRLVPKDELIQAVWPNVVVTDDSLTRCVSDLRGSLSADAQQVIRTVPRRGYIFTATVSIEDASAEPSAGAGSEDIAKSDPADERAAIDRRVPAEGGVPANADAGATDPLPPQAAATRAPERRQLTVMTCETVGLGALAPMLDPEDLRELQWISHRRCTQIIERHGGRPAGCVGDTIQAYFGYPQAGEHETERAILAGLAVIEAVPALPTGRPALRARIGVATGLTIIGDGSPPGAGRWGLGVEHPIVGEPPSLAARLLALAEPGTILISATSRQLTGGLFEYRALPVGDAVAPPAWQVLGPARVEDRFTALHAATTPLAGRAEEIELLLRRWEQAKRGEGSIVLVSGEAGIGKSRLVQTLLDRIGAEPHIKMRNFCSPHHQESPLYPSLMQFARAAGLRRDDTDQQKLAKIEAVLALTTDNFDEAGPVAAELLSIPTGDRYPPLMLTPHRRKAVALRIQLAQIDKLAQRQPLLILYEDLHWSDPMTRESLDLLVERVSGQRILVLLTFRPDFAPPWVGRPHVTLLSLNRLARRERMQMIEHVAGVRMLPPELACHIADRTDGIPLFIEELTKSVVESDLLVAAGDQYLLTGPVTPLAIPVSLQASLLARLDRLGPARALVQIASALGRCFGHDLISAVADLPAAALQETLAQIVRAELIYRRGTPPDAEYTFKHALVQDAAYSTLLRADRQALHGKIVATLEAQFPEQVAAEPAPLAQHCVAAGLIDKAIPYWLKAGRQALARSAMAEATALFHKGLDLLVGMADSPWRREQELELRISLGQALAYTKGPSSDSDQTRMRAIALAKEIDRPDYDLWLTCSQSTVHLFRSEHRTAIDLAIEAEAIGAATNDRAVELWGRCAAATALSFLGEFQAARARLEQCQDLAKPEYRQGGPGFSSTPYASMLANLAVVLGYLGEIDEARRCLTEGLAEAYRIDHAASLAEVLTYICWFDVATGAPELEHHAGALQALTIEHHFEPFGGWAAAARGWSLARSGRPSDGLPLILHGLSRVRDSGTLLMTPTMTVLLAETYHKLGRPEDGLAALGEAGELLRRTDEHCAEAEFHRVRGELLWALGDAAGAESGFQEAIRVAERQDAKMLRLRASIGLARLWQEQGKRREAAALLAAGCALFADSLDIPDLYRARALLGALAGNLLPAA
jgi:DNA-binding winged helix-turn-helix (wHTH) protein/class 3 adenylate cyclase/tetratricopeptide (TPR) repeat protein